MTSPCFLFWRGYLSISLIWNLWSSYLSWGLKPAHEPMVFAELVHFDAVAGQLSALVTLVGQQHGGDALTVGQHQFGVQVLFPLDDRLKGGGSGHVEHDEGAHGFAVVDSGHVSKSLLTWNIKKKKKSIRLHTCPLCWGNHIVFQLFGSRSNFSSWHPVCSLQRLSSHSTSHSYSHVVHDTVNEEVCFCCSKISWNENWPRIKENVSQRCRQK